MNITPHSNGCDMHVVWKADQNFTYHLYLCNWLNQPNLNIPEVCEKSENYVRILWRKSISVCCVWQSNTIYYLLHRTGVTKCVYCWRKDGFGVRKHEQKSEDQGSIHGSDRLHRCTRKLKLIVSVFPCVKWEILLLISRVLWN